MSAYYTERRRPKGDARLASILELLGRLDASGTGLLQRQRLVALISSLVPEMTPQSIDLLMDSSMHADQVNVRYSDFLAWLFEGLGRAGPSLPGAISVATWNVAAVNNNPFEYWLAHDDPCYVNLMVAIETCLSSPSPSWDVPVREIFTEGMFQELKALMLEHDIAGVEEVEESMWREDLQKRRVVSEFIKDKSLGSKRLISMPDRITNTVQVVTRAASEYKPPPACRPTVINNYLGDLSTLEVWWDSWKRFMFCQPLAVRSHQGISVRLPCHMLEPIPRSKYPALSEKEERLAIPLQILCQAIFDAVLVHLMHHCSPDGTWQVVKSQIGDHLYRCKAQRTMEILETKYSTVDVVFLQEVASNFCDFFQRSALAQSFTCVLPRSMDGKRDQNSLLLLSTQFFEPQIQDVTSVIEESMEDGVRLVSSDLVAVLAKGRDQRSYLLASFHGDTAGRMTLPLLRALVSAAAQRYPRHILIVGMDANSYDPAKDEQLPFTRLIAEVKTLGLTTCWGEDPDRMSCRTTCCARTSLQPQLNKAISYKDCVSQSDRNPKDLITFNRQQLRLLSPQEVGQPNPLKDNTGQLHYEESMNFPTFDFPSDRNSKNMALEEVNSNTEFDKILGNSSSALTVVHFHAPWALQCKQMNEVMTELAKENSHVKFVKLEAENLPEISLKYEISAVPTFLLFKNQKVVDRLDGANAPALTKKVQHHASIITTTVTAEKEQDTKQDLNTRLKNIINGAPNVLFMKGSPQEPRCGFSRQIVELLNSHGADYSHFDILTDNEVRQGLKVYSNWPTYPQLYVDGELVGGLDIVKELAASGELTSTLSTKEDLNKRLQSLISAAPVMVFMKGNPEGPRCGFSRKLCEILKKYPSVPFKTFDILEDQEVRQGLKTYSNWPTYPQIYVKGELIGGIDIIMELDKDGELESTLTG